MIKTYGLPKKIKLFSQNGTPYPITVNDDGTLNTGGANPNRWSAPSINQVLTSNVQSFANIGSGYSWVMNDVGSSRMFINVALQNNGIEYDGSNISIKISNTLRGIPSGNVDWHISYAFFLDDGTEETLTKVTEFTDSINVSSRTIFKSYYDTLSPMTGLANAKHLQITIHRPFDTFNAQVTVTSIELV